MAIRAGTSTTAWRRSPTRSFSQDLQRLSSTGLEQTLRDLGIGSLVVTGLTTDVCVTQTAREAADRGFHVVVAEDACTTLSNEMHAEALQDFALAFGRVRTTEEILALLPDTADEARPAQGAGWRSTPSAT